MIHPVKEERFSRTLSSHHPTNTAKRNAKSLSKSRSPAVVTVGQLRAPSAAGRLELLGDVPLGQVPRDGYLKMFFQMLTHTILILFIIVFNELIINSSLTYGYNFRCIYFLLKNQTNIFFFNII